MSAEKSDNLSKTSALFILGAIVIIIIAGSIYIWRDTVKQREGSKDTVNSQSMTKGKSSGDLETANWSWVPFLSDKLKFVMRCPLDWNISIWGQNSFAEREILLSCNKETGVVPGGFAMYLSTFNDTSLDLNSWFSQKLTEMTQRQGGPPEVSQFNANDQVMMEACNSTDNKVDSGAISFPTCYVYVHDQDTIIEMKIQAGGQTVTETRKYARALASAFNVIGQVPPDWKKHQTPNAGFQIQYPADRFPSSDDTGRGMSVTFGKTGTGLDPLLSVTAQPGYQFDSARFWYDMAKSSGTPSQRVPLEIPLNGTICLNGASQYNGSVICKVNDVLYFVSLESVYGRVEDFITMYKMIASLKFTDPRIDENHFIYKDLLNKFQVTYPTTYSIMDNNYSMDRPSFDGVSVSESTGVYPPVRAFSVSLQKSNSSYEECQKSESCILYGLDLKKFKDTTFKGIAAKEKDYSPDEEYALSVVESQANTKRIVMKKDNNIYLFKIITSLNGDNSSIDDIVSGFSFIK